MALVQFDTTQEEEEKINYLQKLIGTTTRTKVLRFSLSKTYDLLKDLNDKIDKK
jgi:hypothetical protein